MNRTSQPSSKRVHAFSACMYVCACNVSVCVSVCVVIACPYLTLAGSEGQLGYIKPAALSASPAKGLRSVCVCQCACESYHWREGEEEILSLTMKRGVWLIQLFTITDPTLCHIRIKYDIFISIVRIFQISVLIYLTYHGLNETGQVHNISPSTCKRMTSLKVSV